MTRLILTGSLQPEEIEPCVECHPSRPRIRVDDSGAHDAGRPQICENDPKISKSEQ